MKVINCLIFLILISACKKGEVSGNEAAYIGAWSSTTSDDRYTLIIKESGNAEYAEYHLGSYKTVSGGIYFDGYDFKIGTNRINKKFKANQPPKRVTISANPYKYYYTAVFNGNEYKKEQ